MNVRKTALQETEELVALAKTWLISAYGYSEAQAHQYILKKAMDQRKNKRQIAEAILKQAQKGRYE